MGSRLRDDGGVDTSSATDDRSLVDWVGLAALILIPVGAALLTAGILLHQSGFLHATGIEPRTPSTAYNAWSGFLSDVGEYTIAVGLFGHLYHYLRQHNCREHRCWRMGWHIYVDKDAQPHPACRRHHPTHPHRSGRRFHFHELHAQKLAGIPAGADQTGFTAGVVS